MTSPRVWPRIPNRAAVMRSQRQGESLRDTELRWQAKADPMIAEQFAAGRSKREIAEEIGTSKGGVLSALRRHFGDPKAAFNPRPAKRSSMSRPSPRSTGGKKGAKRDA